MNNVKQDLTQISEGLYDDIYGDSVGWNLVSEGTRASLSNVNYWRFGEIQISLDKDVKYKISITPSSTFTQDAIMVGTDQTLSGMVATLGTNVSFVQGVAVDYEYTPSVEGVKALRIYGNADKIASVYVYTEKREGGCAYHENTIPHIQRTNKVYADLNRLKSDIDMSVPTILAIRNGAEQVTKTITIPAVGAKSKYIVPIRMHYESSKYNPQATDVFFDESCNTDFSDVRFFDSNGRMLKARFGPAVNMEFLTDTLIYAFPKLFPLSNGYCIASFGGAGKGIYLSRSKCHNWGDPLTGTSDVATSHPSDVNGYVSMFVVGVDSSDNVYAYAGGKLYKLVAGNDYSYSTINEVLDFTWTDTTNNNATIYPDIQPGAFAIDGDGRMYIGLYQKQFRGCVYVSSDGGDTWTQKYVTGIGPDASDHHQHVHQIKYDPYQDKIYVCVDDGNSVYNGSFILTTTDGGNTWTDITVNISGEQDVRGKDYYPCYCGNGYRLGSGETYILGGACTIRSEDDVHFEHVVRGFSATRSIVDFGNDDVLLTGTQRTQNSSENQILVSYDKGKTWISVAKSEANTNTSGGGDGYRNNLSATLFADETEPCAILTNSETTLNIKRTRVYNGGNHHFREAYVLLENIPNADIVITAKTGYAVEYPYQTLEGYDVDGLVYSIAFDEGSGRKAIDSNGTIVNLPVNAEWENVNFPVRYGEFGGNNRPAPFEYYSACKPNGVMNFGKIPSLSFNKNYTITFWLNEKGRLNNYASSQRLDTPFSGETAENVMYTLMSFGASTLVRYNNYLGLVSYGSTTDSYATLATFNSAVPFCNDYSFVAVMVENGKISVSVNGSVPTVSTINNNRNLNDIQLSSADFVVGSKDNSIGFIGDIKVYNTLLSNADLINIYKGYQYM